MKKNNNNVCLRVDVKRRIVLLLGTLIILQYPIGNIPMPEAVSVSTEHMQLRYIHPSDSGTNMSTIKVPVFISWRSRRLIKICT